MTRPEIVPLRPVRRRAAARSSRRARCRRRRPRPRRSPCRGRRTRVHSASASAPPYSVWSASRIAVARVEERRLGRQQRHPRRHERARLRGRRARCAGPTASAPRSRRRRAPRRRRRSARSRRRCSRRSPSAGRPGQRDRVGAHDRAVERLGAQLRRPPESVYSPMTTSPEAPVSSAGNWPTMKSCAYQSLHASPIAPACGGVQRAVRRRRRSRAGSRARACTRGRGSPRRCRWRCCGTAGCHRYICISGRRAVGRREHVRVVDVVAVRPGRGAVDRVQLQRRRAPSKAPAAGVEADRRRGQVVVEAVGEVEGLDGVLLAVDVPRSTCRRSTSTGARRRSRCRRPARTGTRTRRRSARPPRRRRDVVVVEVAVGVGVRPVEVRRARRVSQPRASRSTVAARAAQRRCPGSAPRPAPAPRT